MKTKSILLSNFRKALKAEFNDQNRQRGRGFKSELAKDAEISRAYLNDIGMSRKAGSEDVRHRIARALGYSYSDFQLLGQELSDGKDLDKARKAVSYRQLLRPPEDGYIEKILISWPDFSEEEKGDICQYCQKLQLDSWQHSSEIKKYPKNSKERFSYIWEQVIKKVGSTVPFDKSILDLCQKYEDGKISDIELFNNALDYANSSR